MDKGVWVQDAEKNIWISEEIRDRITEEFTRQ
jgi:hypothetical protein